MPDGNSTAYGCSTEFLYQVMGPPVQICMQPEQFVLMVDGISTSYLTVDQQQKFFGGKASIFHVEPGNLDMGCEALRVYQEWSNKGVIAKGDFTPLLSSTNAISNQFQKV